MIKAITRKRSRAFLPSPLPPPKTLAHSHASAYFSLFYYFKRLRLTPFITEHCSRQSCNRVRLFRHLGTKQSLVSISESDVILGGIIQHSESSLICHLYHICSHTHPWFILSCFITLLIFHPAISPHDAFDFHYVWEVNLTWPHICLLFMLLAVWTSSLYHRKDKEWKISRRAQGRVESSVSMCVLRKSNSQVCKLLKDIPDLQMTLFLNYL